MGLDLSKIAAERKKDVISQHKPMNEIILIAHEPKPFQEILIIRAYHILYVKNNFFLIDVLILPLPVNYLHSSNHGSKEPP